MDKLNVPKLNIINYFIWCFKIKAALSLKRWGTLISEIKAESLNEKNSIEWEQKNNDAVAYIKLSLSNEQALQFAAKDNAKVLWDKIKSTFIDQVEDRSIDAGNELKNLEMKFKKSANDYIARAQSIKTKFQTLGLIITDQELVFYTVRGLKEKFSKFQDLRKTHYEKTMDEILKIIQEGEQTNTIRSEGINAEKFYSRKKTKVPRLYCICKTS